MKNPKESSSSRKQHISIFHTPLDISSLNGTYFQSHEMTSAFMFFSDVERSLKSKTRFQFQAQKHDREREKNARETINNGL
jgi:hypothetical protein